VIIKTLKFVVVNTMDSCFYCVDMQLFVEPGIEENQCHITPTINVDKVIGQQVKHDSAVIQWKVDAPSDKTLVSSGQLGQPSV